MKLIAVIPAYNEARHIGQVVAEARSYVDSVVVVDDCSRDQTSQLAREAGGTVLRHRLNLGKSAALRTGCTAAGRLGADIIVFLDSDGQHRPSDIPRITQPIREGKVDVVIGCRQGGDKMPFIRFFGNRVVQYAITLLFQVRITDVQSGFRAFRTTIYPKLQWKANRYHADAEITARIGRHRLRYHEIPIATIYHDSYKGMTVIDGIKLLANILLWRFTL